MAITTAEREAVRQRALAAGKTPTTAGINATVAKNRALAQAASVKASMAAGSTADIYQRVTGESPGAAENALTPGQYAAQKLNQFGGSPQLGKIDVSKGYAGELAQAYLAWLKRVGPEGYVGVNSGKRDDREYYSVLEGAQRYAAMPTGTTSRNPNIPIEKSLAGEAEDARIQGSANKTWNDLATELLAASKRASPAKAAKKTKKAKK